MIENFFSILKNEMLYDQENKYEILDDLIKGIDDYIYYYNHGIIELKWVSPINYRLQSFIRNYL